MSTALLFGAPPGPLRAQSTTVPTIAVPTATTTAPGTTSAPATTTAPGTTTAPATTTAPTTTATTAVAATTGPTAPLVSVHGAVTTTTPATATTTRPPQSVSARSGPPPASLSDASVSSVLAGLARTAPSSTADLLAALAPLQNYGFTSEAAVLLGMGRFPMAGPAYYRDDFGDPRETPEPHSHKGTDIFAAFGTPVRSPADGVLRYADEPAAGGLAAYITEPSGTWYYLAHLQQFAPGKTSGQTVKVGDVIGFNGDTGNAKGSAPHVHFEFHPGGGAAVNPKPLLDQWLAEALAAVPDLLAPFRQDITRPLTNVGLVRRFDQGMLAGTSRLLGPPVVAPAERPPEQRLADALLSPLTPPVLRSLDPAP